MKPLLLVVSAIVAATCVASGSAAQTNWQAGVNYNRSVSDSLTTRSGKEASRTSCLLNKVTKKIECRTHAQWRRIADRLDARSSGAPARSVGAQDRAPSI